MGCKRIWWLVVFESSKMSFFLLLQTRISSKPLRLTPTNSEPFLKDWTENGSVIMLNADIYGCGFVHTWATALSSVSFVEKLQGLATPNVVNRSEIEVTC